ncbi:MAG: hypothetical protein ACXVYB_16445 [Arthrobacter sp.]
MSTDQNAPDDLVGGGVQGGAKPVPRATTGEPEDQPQGQPAQAANAPGIRPEPSDGSRTGDTTNPPGPAQEQDEQTGDDRGLTTDPGSSD